MWEIFSNLFAFSQYLNFKLIEFSWRKTFKNQKSNQMEQFFPLPYNKIYYPTYGGPFCIANDVIRSSES